MFSLIDALENTYPEVNYFDFYRDLFPIGSFEEKGVYEDGKYNGIIVSIHPGDDKVKRFTLTDDLDVLDDLVQTDDFCLMSPMSYAGKSRKSEYARYMYALAIDLDGVDSLDNWHFFCDQIEKGHEMLSFIWGLPKPTYLIASGTGIHIYYVFQEPIPLFKNIVEQLEKLKKRLTMQAWTMGASSLTDNVQYESLFQGFRVVGTITKNGDRCRAFRVGDKVTIDYLNRYVPADYAAEITVYKSKLPIQKAKEKYPEWYESRIVNNNPRGYWICKRDLYDWWKRKMLDIDGASQGHRYWCIMTLATYAKKCGISRRELEKDALSLIPAMNQRGDNFSADDVLHALEAYSDSYINYPIKTIVNRTGIQITRNKRNGRKQSLHLKIARATLNVMNEEAGKTLQGRPAGSGTAEHIVKEWQQLHPGGKKIDCHRDTNLSRVTIDKWWNYNKSI